jgi:hypothetical protein
MINKIFNYIRANRVSTTEISGILGKTGSITNIKPINYTNSLPWLFLKIKENKKISTTLIRSYIFKKW